MMAATALSTNANGLARPAALLPLGAEVAVLPAAPLPVMLAVDSESVVVSVVLAVLVRVAMLMVVLRTIAVPVPAEAAVPAMVVVGMLEFKLAMIELTVLLSDMMTELADALAMLAELVAEAEETADAEPPDREN